MYRDKPIREETEIIMKKMFKYRLEGLSHKQIAAKLNHSLQTVRNYFSQYKELWVKEKAKQSKELDELSAIKLDNLFSKSLNKADKLLENPKARTAQKQVEMVWKAKKLLNDKDTQNVIPVRVSFDEN